MAKTSFLKLVVVIWSVTPTFHFFSLFSSMKSDKVLFLRNFESLKQRKPKKNDINKSKNARFPKRKMYTLMLFISKLSSVTVGFLVKNGFGVSSKRCYKILKRF